MKILASSGNTTMWSVELEATQFADDTFNGTYDECVSYLHDHGYSEQDARLAQIEVDSSGYVVETLEIVEDWDDLVSDTESVIIHFINNGSAVMRLDNGEDVFVHAYDDMYQMARDYREFRRDSDLSFWDGNEPEMWDENDAHNVGCYRVDDGDLSDLSSIDTGWGWNVEEFVEAIS